MNRKEFLTSLGLARPCLGNNKTIPILSYFCFSGNNITSYNGYEGITTQYNHGLNCCIEGELLINIINSYDTDTVDVIQGNTDVVIKSGKSEIKLPILPITDFVSPFNVLVDTTEFQITMDDKLADGLSKCLISSGKEKFKEEEYGVTMKIDKNGINMYSHDGRRVSKYVYSSNEEQAVIDIILTPFLCSQVVNKIQQGGTGTFFIGNKAVTGDFGDFLIMSLIKPIDPNRKPVLPLDFEGKVFSKYDISSIQFESLGKDLLQALTRAGVLFQNVRNKVLTFESDGSVLKMTANTGMSSIDEEVQVKLPAVKFNADLTILDILSVVNKIGTVVGNSVILVGSDGGTFVTLIATE